MAKMFYTQAEASGRLGKTPEELKKMVREGKLREFMDNGPVYRVEDIDKMAVKPAPGGADAVDLELVDEQAGAAKDDTVITSAGVSVFDDEDLQVDVDPMAQTQITPSVEDQISLETTGSGSGLLDLTREADDTSLGAELLEEIYPTGPAVEPAELAPAHAAAPEPAVPAMEPGAMFAAPTMIEAADPMASAFSGMAFAGILAAAFAVLVVMSIALDIWPTFLESLAKENNPFFLGGGLAVLAILFWVVGMVVGKSSSAPRM